MHNRKKYAGEMMSEAKAELLESGQLLMVNDQKARNFGKPQFPETVAAEAAVNAPEKEERKGLLEDIFKPQESIIFKDRSVMHASYTPSTLPHREVQIKQLGKLLAPAFKGGIPSNVLIYGMTGTGKTATVRYVSNELKAASEKYGVPMHCVYLNCEVVDTHYRVMQNIANNFITDWDERIPFTGWPTDEVYAKLRSAMEKAGGLILIIFDEVDRLLCKSGDDALYNLSRINSDIVKAKVCIIGISNDLKFTEYLDPRVRSSLSEEELIFPPYDAGQLKDILKQRAVNGFVDSVVHDGVIELCAAVAAREHGDARRAIELLRIAGELSERQSAKSVTTDHVKMACKTIESDRIAEVIRKLPIQSKLVLLSVRAGDAYQQPGATGECSLTTGEVYGAYRDMCKKTGMDVLTQRRVADLISELDMLGLITARVISKGRQGRTREISISTDVAKRDLANLLEDDEILKEVLDFKPAQSKLL